MTLKQIFEKIVLEEFKDDDIQVHVEFSKFGNRIDPVVEGQEQDWWIYIDILFIYVSVYRLC